MNAPYDFDAELRAIADLPDDSPRTLPGRFYTAPEQFTRERAEVVSTGWHCLGRVDALAEPGDYIATQIADEPIVAVRGGDGDIAVLSNICRHRGMPLVQGQGRTKRLVCPYHAWTYGLDGALQKAPHLKNAGFDPKTCALPRFTAEAWNGFLYVSLDENPAPLAPQLADLDALLAPYDPGAYELVHTEEEVWACNWKCLVENFMEGYHLSVVHPQTLRSYTPSELARKLASGPVFTSYIAHYPEGTPSRGKGAPGLTADQRNQSVLFSVFPCQVVSISANLLVSLSLRPIATDRVDVTWTMSIYPGDRDDEVIQHRIGLWQQVNSEDREQLEALQKGLASRHASSGPLAGADMEGTIRDFHLFLARTLLGR
ncbi:MAG: aromatic ring-hydroxylating dioxygenase subunit alpha [Pseudomonadota bacterium]